VIINVSRIFAIVLVAAAVACGGGSEDPGNQGGAAGTTFPQGGQGGGPGIDGGPSGFGGWPGSSGIDGGPWVPSESCYAQAIALVETLTPAECYGQMTQVDSSGLTVAEATTSLLGSVLSGGGSDPTSGNTIADWLTLVTSYLDIVNQFATPIGLLYGIDAVHGNGNVQDAVIFPHPIGLGATRNLALVEQVGRLTALEMLGVGANWTFAPTVGPALDERWGRTYEAFAETPDLAGQMAAATIKGLQTSKLGGNQSVLACGKHYAGDGLTEGGKNAGNVTTDEATFRKVGVEPYRAAIAAGVGSIMASYSAYQGTKMTGNKQ